MLKDPYNWLNEGGEIKKTKFFSDTSCGNFLLNQEVKLRDHLMKMNICRCAVGRKARIIVGTHNSRTDCSQRSIIKPCDFQVNIGYTEMVWRNQFGKQTLRSCVYFLSLTLHKCGGYKARPNFPDML